MGQAGRAADTPPMWIGQIVTAAEALLALGVAAGVLLIRP
jgi:hypothetical protein